MNMEHLDSNWTSQMLPFIIITAVIVEDKNVQKFANKTEANILYICLFIFSEKNVNNIS